MKVSRTSARVALLAASSFTALVIASPAMAQMALTHTVTPTRDIVTNDTVTPGPGNPATGANYANSPQVLSTGVNGVGQMISITLPFLNLCTGTLINPRTVITAAHCVYDLPKQDYGSNTGIAGGIPAGSGLIPTVGVPLSFGFNSTNRCTGSATSVGNGCRNGTGAYEAWRNAGFQTVVGQNIYNANQVWYGTASQPVDLGGGGEFGNEDIALVTLDTHTKNIPTWTLLFSPLSGPAHSTITGYGAAGVGTSGIGSAAGIDYRRRSAENMVDALMSSADWTHNPFIGGPDFHGFDTEAHSLYWMDFDDPHFDALAAVNSPSFFNTYFDFNGLGGHALPHEGITAGGDSGGPLIIDQTFRNPDGTFRPVVAGVLTGSWSFDGGAGTYGEFAVYPPLYLYWQEIVANNPYHYVSAKGGNGDWFDPAHWVQDMDPNYAVAVNGSLMNTLPDVPQLNADSTAGRFGKVCALDGVVGDLCSTPPSSPYPTGDGHYVLTPGGPGSTGFVPNNIEPINSLDPNQYKQAHYFDVTLNKLGRTSLSQSATIDKLTIDGLANLNITSTGNLKVWAEYNQLGGWTNVDGSLKADESLMVNGLLTGAGTFDPTYLTVVGGIVAPGSKTPGGQQPIGTLTIKGDVILSSASLLAIDLMRNKGDLLKIVADSDNAGVLVLNSGAIYFGQGNGALVRDGQSFTVATSQGGITGAFGTVLANLGVLRPTVGYTTNNVNVSLKAGRLATYLGSSSATAVAFANALDNLRGDHYTNLYNLYGNIDLMSPDRMAAAFNGLAPSIIGETQLLQDRQSEELLGSIGDRLALIGTGAAKGISFSGATAGFANRQPMTLKEQLGLTSTARSTSMPIAGGITGFVTAGGDSVRSSYGDSRVAGSGRHSRYFASGVEAPFGDLTVGTAVGYAVATSNAGQDRSTSNLTQAAAYATLPIGKNGYVGGIVAAEQARAESNRLATDTVSMFQLSGTARSSRYMATVEAGARTGIGHGLTLNPRAQLGYSHYSMSSLREEGAETALDLNGLTINRLEGRIGARLDGAAHISGWTVTPNIQADYVRLLSGARNGMNVSFAAAPGYSFMLPLTNGGSGWMEAKGGLALQRGHFTLGVSGQATVGDAPLSDKRGMVDVAFRF